MLKFIVLDVTLYYIEKVSYFTKMSFVAERKFTIYSNLGTLINLLYAKQTLTRDSFIHEIY